MSNRQELKNLIKDLSAKGQYVEAIPPMERYCELIKEEFGESSDRYVTVKNDLGGMYRNIGDFKNAETTFNEVLNLIKNKLGDKSLQYATATVNLACMYRFTNEFEKAERLFLSAIEIYDLDIDIELIKTSRQPEITNENTIIEKSTLYANVCNNIGVMYQDMKNFEKAIYYHNKSLEMLQNTSNYEYLAITLNNFVNPYLHAENFEDAKRVINQSLEILEKHISVIHPFYSTALNNLGTVYFKENNYKKALECFEETERHLKNSFGVNSPQYQSCLSNIKLVKEYLQNSEV